MTSLQSVRLWAGIDVHRCSSVVTSRTIRSIDPCVHCVVQLSRNLHVEGFPLSCQTLQSRGLSAGLDGNRFACVASSGDLWACWSACPLHGPAFPRFELLDCLLSGQVCSRQVCWRGSVVIVFRLGQLLGLLGSVYPSAHFFVRL